MLYQKQEITRTTVENFYTLTADEILECLRIKYSMPSGKLTMETRKIVDGDVIWESVEQLRLVQVFELQEKRSPTETKTL